MTATLSGEQLVQRILLRRTMRCHLEGKHTPEKHCKACGL